MAVDGSAQRNVWIEFASDPGVIRGGLCAASSLTRREFLDMVDIVFHAPSGISASLYGSNTTISHTNRRLEHGRYILSALGSGEQIQSSTAPYYPRMLSPSNTPTDVRFRD
jgi:hypothetical protein